MPLSFGFRKEHHYNLLLQRLDIFDNERALFFLLIKMEYNKCYVYMYVFMYTFTIHFICT